jgi:hypothetical protein
MNLDNIEDYVWDCVRRHTERSLYNDSWHCIVNSVWFHVQRSVYDPVSPSIYAPIRDSVKRQYESR